MKPHERRKEELVELLRRRIRGTGLSLADIDRRLRWSPGYLSQILNGHNSFRVEHLFRVTEAAGLSPRELFEELEPLRPELPGGVSMDAFMDLLERQVDRAVDARLEEKEKREEAEAKRKADEDRENDEAD